MTAPPRPKLWAGFPTEHEVARKPARRGLSRRRALEVAAGIVAASAAGAGGWVWRAFATADIDTVGALDFANPLHIPPVDEGRLVGGRRVFELDIGPTTADLGNGGPIPVWGVNGGYLGPTLRAATGDAVTVHVANRLDEATTIHWHGMRLPARADGGPHQPIAPGETWSPAWTIEQPTATLWYHPHPHARTGEQIYRGIAGLLIIDDPEPSLAGLPSGYGRDDIPVVLQDKRFHDDGSLDFGSALVSPAGFLGDTMVINGTINPHHVVTTDTVRLRVLNASNARVYHLGLHDDRDFALVATGGGLLPAPIRMSRVSVSPGDRVEIVLGVTAGERVVLRSFRPEMGAGLWNDRFTGGHDRLDLLELRAAVALDHNPPLPDHLAASVPASPDIAARREIRLTSASSIGGHAMDMTRIDLTVAVDTSEVWRVTNEHAIAHNFHIHGVQFQILDLDGDPPAGELTGSHDTVFLPPGASVRLLIAFADHADPHTPYMYHCHLTEHEDRGMMGQFVVVDASRETAPNVSTARHGPPDVPIGPGGDGIPP